MCAWTDDYQCSSDPCDCSGVDPDDHCIFCHDNGCGQCETGYFRLDYSWKCISCGQVMPSSCLFCQDFMGCGQCQGGYNRVFDDVCGWFTCVDPSI